MGNDTKEAEKKYNVGVQNGLKKAHGDQRFIQTLARRIAKKIIGDDLTEAEQVAIDEAKGWMK